MTADDHAVDVVDVGAGSLGQIAFEAGRIEGAAHADDAVLGQPRGFQCQIGECIHRVGDHDDDGAGRVSDDVSDDTLHDVGIGPDQLFAGHSRFAGDSRRDDHDIRVGGFLVVVGSADEFRVEIHQRGGLEHVQHLTLGEPLLDVDENHLACHFAASHHIRTGCTYGSCTYDGNFCHGCNSLNGLIDLFYWGSESPADDGPDCQSLVLHARFFMLPAHSFPFPAITLHAFILSLFTFPSTFIHSSLSRAVLPLVFVRVGHSRFEPCALSAPFLHRAQLRIARSTYSRDT